MLIYALGFPGYTPALAANPGSKISGDVSSPESTTATKPTLKGTAKGVSKVDVAVYKKGSSKPAFEKKSVAVKKGAWSVKVSKTLSKATYEVRLTSGSGKSMKTLDTSPLTIGKTVQSGSSSPTPAVSDSSLTVTTIPLLTGGTVRAGESVPVAYLQLRNSGKEAAHVTGFTLKQNGTAPATLISTLSTVDDKGGSRATSALNPFKAGSSGFAPTEAIIAPGAVKLFTVKANMATNLSNALWKNYQLDVTGVTSDGFVKATYPLRGTTWMVGF